jgi:SCY1-like protein 3
LFFQAGRTEPTSEYGAARDAYGFGVLAEQLLEYLISSDADSDVDATSSKTFELRVQDECMNPEPSQRPKLSSLLQDRLFK